jgi:hypothetical protein
LEKEGRAKGKGERVRAVFYRIQDRYWLLAIGASILLLSVDRITVDRVTVHEYSICHEV